MSKKTEKLLMEVRKGCLVPADSLSAGRLKAKGFKMGDQVLITISKPRYARFHRLAHAFGQLVSDNIEDFDGMNCHAVLKRLQWESGIGCEEMAAKVPGAGVVPIRIPKSLSFASMDQGEFHEVFLGLCRHVAKNYWTDLSEDQIMEMAELMVQE